jgi:hypothetical protein
LIFILVVAGIDIVMRTEDMAEALVTVAIIITIKEVNFGEIAMA